MQFLFVSDLSGIRDLFASFELEILASESFHFHTLFLFQSEHFQKK